MRYSIKENLRELKEYGKSRAGRIIKIISQVFLVTLLVGPATQLQGHRTTEIFRGTVGGDDGPGSGGTWHVEWNTRSARRR